MNIETKILSADKELISSGSFLSYNDNEKISIKLINDESPLSIAFEFIKDEENKEVRKKVFVEDTCLLIKLYNYSDLRFTTQPGLIGEIYNRKFFYYII
jgi:hypothetical protein